MRANRNFFGLVPRAARFYFGGFQDSNNVQQIVGASIGALTCFSGGYQAAFVYPSTRNGRVVPLLVGMNVRIDQRVQASIGSSFFRCLRHLNVCLYNEVYSAQVRFCVFVRQLRGTVYRLTTTAVSYAGGRCSRVGMAVVGWEAGLGGWPSGVVGGTAIPGGVTVGHRIVAFFDGITSKDREPAATVVGTVTMPVKVPLTAGASVANAVPTTLTCVNATEVARVNATGRLSFSVCYSGGPSNAGPYVGTPVPVPVEVWVDAPLAVFRTSHAVAKEHLVGMM